MSLTTRQLDEMMISNRREIIEMCNKAYEKLLFLFPAKPGPNDDIKKEQKAIQTIQCWLK